MVGLTQATRWIAAEEVARITGWSMRTIRRRGASGELPRARDAYGHFQYCSATVLSIAEANTAPTGREADISADAEAYANAPSYARKHADRYTALMTVFQGLNGRELTARIEQWNKDHPDDTTSVSSLLAARKAFAEGGIAALLSRYGTRSGATIVPDIYMEYFKGLYLKEGSPGAMSCWRCTMGWAIQRDPAVTPDSFPSYASFIRRLRADLLPESIYRARRGAKAWNRKYASYIRRDYSNVLAGQVWVSDHAQIDIACALPDGKYCFPWVTVWRDFKSGKWLGWELREQAPSSDPIFSAFYRAASIYGVCSTLILDNGKDYRCKDFAGGRRKIRVEVDQQKVRSLTAGLNIETVFAWPYNAQSKPIERDFLRNKEWLSKHAVGYRGGNVVERPESLNKRIGENAIETLDELRELFDVFVTEVINRSVVGSGYRAGNCPDQIWDDEAQTAADNGLLRSVTRDALKLFCARASGTMTVGRNGVRDADLGCDYWADWMFAHKGRKVYMRRDPKQHESAWVFDTATDDFLGAADLVQAVPALARTDVERGQLQEAIRLKRRAGKIARVYARADVNPSLREKVANLVTVTRAINESRGYTPADQPAVRPTVILTDMDRVVAQEAAMAGRGKSIARKLGISDISSESNTIDPLAAYYPIKAASA